MNNNFFVYGVSEIAGMQPVEQYAFNQPPEQQLPMATGSRYVELQINTINSFIEIEPN